MVHEVREHSAVVSQWVLLHLLEGCVLGDEIHGLLRHRAPHELQYLSNLPFGVL